MEVMYVREQSEELEIDDRTFEIKTEIEFTVRDTYYVKSNLYEITEDREWLDISDNEVESESQTQDLIEKHIERLEGHASKLVKYS